MARPKPEIFDITKRKFHNVLQGVADHDVRLTDEDKQAFIDWSDENATRFWLDDKGPLKNSDVIVIDDPQGKEIKRYHTIFFLTKLMYINSVWHHSSYS